ncbi:MAG: DUF433 domain-containing protein [Oculatellaceae cyanobacterium Prado106]|jgi:uncharacterized protein (DUF433 family)|nr:DUF433 domain-containing protein [Oculatellaceae cyanobacterium Prado106]
MSIPVEFAVSAPPFRWDEAGGIRIGQSRVTFDSLIAAYHQGATPEEMAVQYPVLSLSEIYSVIAYYLSHRQEMDDYLEQRSRRAQQQRDQLVQRHNLADLRRHLLDRSNLKEN